MAYRKLGRDSKHRRSMLANLTKAVIMNERIQTTQDRAKEARKFVDKMITYGKKGDLVSRRKALAFLHNDKEVVNKLFNDLNIFIGNIASGDKFIIDREEKDDIRSTFNALCIEMEGASIAQVCYLDNVQFLVIRSITDKLDGSSKIDFEEFLESSSKKVASILKEILLRIV